MCFSRSTSITQGCIDCVIDMAFGIEQTNQELKYMNELALITLNSTKSVIKKKLESTTKSYDSLASKLTPYAKEHVICMECYLELIRIIDRNINKLERELNEFGRIPSISTWFQ